MICFSIANLSDEAIDALVSGLETGVYYGWTQIGELGSEVYPMVMSLGWNPYFKNEKRSAVSFLTNSILMVDSKCIIGSTHYP